MLKILVPVDGSECAVRALQEAIAMAKRVSDETEIHAINVQAPIVSGHIRMFVTKEALDEYYASEHERALASVLPALEASGLPFKAKKRLGQYADEITKYAVEIGCDQIFMGTRGLGAIGGLLLGSVTRKVIHLAKVPVTLVK